MQNILIVDDEKDLVSMLSDTVRRWGYNPITALDGEEALDQFHSHPIDLVVSDIRLPKMDGVTLLDRIKDRDESAEVIMITGQPEVKSAVDAMKTGAFDYLIKPVDLSEMKLKIERALEKKEILSKVSTLKGINWAMIISIPIWLGLGFFLTYLLRF